jgi:hypothetical protein
VKLWEWFEWRGLGFTVWVCIGCRIDHGVEVFVYMCIWKEVLCYGAVCVFSVSYQAEICQFVGSVLRAESS